MYKEVMYRVAITLISFISIGSAAEVVTFENNWAKSPLFSVTSETRGGVNVVFSMHTMVVEETIIDGKAMKTCGVPGMFLQNNEGAPNLAGTGRYLAVPQGAKAEVTVIDARKEVYKDIEVAPAPNIPLDTDRSPVHYRKDMTIYSRNAFYPESPVQVSEPMKIRGVDAVILGVTPFQYNPVSKELIAFTDIKIQIDFVGGTRRFGEYRLRSRFWEPVLKNHLLNYESLPKVDFYHPQRLKARDGYEYIIIIPDDPVFEAWADTIKAWRKLQGISTEVFTLSEVGGSTAGDIENFLNDAYNNWDPAPAAFLLLSDYPSSGRPYGITSPVWGDDYCVSDNFYADVDGDHLPDMHHARITAQNEEHLANSVTKFLSYEREPYTEASFYDNPLIACGWQTERWFQLCAEVVAGFMENKLGKHPNRQYNIYNGNPSAGGSWSSNNSTAAVVDYFSGLGYIASANPNGESYWNNGTTAGITNAINTGTFLLQHRDHGNTSGWGEPDYNSNNLDALTNDKYVFVYSTNCLTGKFDDEDETFTEKFHRIPNGALGVNAASETSYSFVNDTYIWGTYDCLWPDFMPDYPAADITGLSDLRPCMAMSSGKIFLEASGWPSNTNNKEVTYYLFHHHGDAFMTLYSEEPRDLSVVHNAAQIVSASTFSVTADDGSVIALSCKGEIIGVAEGSGSAIDIPLLSQPVPSEVILVTVTKANFFRYEKEVPVIAADYPFVSVALKVIDDSGNNDGKVNAGETIDLGIWAKNYGKGTGQSVYGLFSTTDPCVTQLEVDSSWYGDIPEKDSVLSNPRYRFTVSDTCSNNHKVNFTVTFRDKDSTWESNNFVTVYTPIMEYVDVTVEGGNNNGAIEPGEEVDLVVTIINDGEAEGGSVYARLLQADNFITLNRDSSFYGNVQADNQASNSSNPFKITAHQLTPEGHRACFRMVIMDKRPHLDFVSDTFSFILQVGTPPPPFVLFEDDFEYSGTDSFAIIWSTSGNWNRSTDDAHSQTHAAYSGDVVDGNSHLTLKNALDLSAFSEAELCFWHTHEIDNLFWGDAIVQVSTDGGTDWSDLWSASSDDLPWSEKKIFLTSLSSEMLFRYRLEARSVFQDYSDWFIDDFKITIPYDNAPPYFDNTTVWKDVAQTGPFPVQSTITDASGVESASLHYRVGSGSWNTLDLTSQSADLYEATIPGQGGTGRIDYYLEATDKWLAGTANTGTDPVGADQSSGYFSFQYGVVGIINLPEVVTLNICNFQHNGQLNIHFSLPTQMKVNMSVYNVLGQEVATIINWNVKRGKHSVLWNRKGSSARTASGIYLLSFEARALKASEAAKSFKKIERILLVK